MTSAIVRDGRQAWERLKRGPKHNSGGWDDWVAVGRAFLEGRGIAMRMARTTVRMDHLPEIEAWRETLSPRQRAPVNAPCSVLVARARSRSRTSSRVTAQVSATQELQELQQVYETGLTAVPAVPAG